MQREECKESLLISEGDLSSEENFRILRHRPSSLLSTRAFLATSCVLVLSLALNVYHGFKSYLRLEQPGPGFVKRPSYGLFGSNIFFILSCWWNIAGLEYHKLIIYHAHTDFWGKNETLADELWESLSTDAVTIAVDKNLAAQKGLPPSDTFYWDTDKSLYHIKAIHDIHCLVGFSKHPWPSYWTDPSLESYSSHNHSKQATGYSYQCCRYRARIPLPRCSTARHHVCGRRHSYALGRKRWTRQQPSDAMPWLGWAYPVGQRSWARLVLQDGWWL